MRTGRPSRQPIDSQIRDYYDHRVRGPRLVDDQGRVYDRTCAACGHGGRDGDKCALCKKAWGYEDRLVRVGDVQRTRRPGEIEVGMVEGAFARARLGTALKDMLVDPYWKFPTLILMRYALAAPAQKYEVIAEHANKEGWPSRSGKSWTAEMARDWCKLTRKEITRRIEESEAERLAG